MRNKNQNFLKKTECFNVHNEWNQLLLEIGSLVSSKNPSQPASDKKYNSIKTVHEVDKWFLQLGEGKNKKY